MESFRARSAATQPPAPPARGTASERLVWIDWLKVLSVVAVFVYHAAEPFLVINWLVSNDERSITLSAVAGFAYLFGLPLMFLLAGATAWLSLGRRSLGGYGMIRAQRLLVPLVVGILVLTPLQWWLVAAIARGGEDPLNTIGWFFGGIRLEATPRWFGDYGLHLWFIAFLLAYAILSLPLLGALRRPAGARLLDRLAGLPTPILLFLLFVPILASQWLLRIPAPAYRDWADFVLWLGFFLVGVILIADPRLLDRVVGNGLRLVGVGLALLAIALVMVGVFLATGVIPAGGASTLTQLEQGPAFDAASLSYITVRTAAGTALVGGALWLGVRFLHRQPSWLPWASRAVLPFYVLHHPITLAVAAVVVQWPLGVWPKFAVILGVSAVASFAATVLFMRSRLGRAVFGSSPEGSRSPATAPVVAPADPFAIHAGEPVAAADALRSVVDVLQASVARHAGSQALQWKEGGRWTGMTFAELWARVRAASLGLQQRGVRAGDHVVIISRSRPEWVIADFAALALGAVVCPIYPAESDARIEGIARGLRPRLMFVEDERQLSRFGDIAPTILLAGPDDASRGAVTLADLEGRGASCEPAAVRAWESGIDGLDRSTLATIVQTIDEEGVARGAVLTHGNVLHNLVAARDRLPLRRGDVMLSTLPLSHILERSSVLIGL
ncbi:MAG TPA: AMP-binding protein, partial [Candidatus Limnocylindria bacterium]